MLEEKIATKEGRIVMYRNILSQPRLSDYLQASLDLLGSPPLFDYLSPTFHSPRASAISLLCKFVLEIKFLNLPSESEGMSNMEETPSHTVESRMEDRRLTILYGSQTGTAQEVAERMGREARRFHFTPLVAPMNNMLVQELTKQSVVIFVAATTGQGDDPDNMKEFFTELWAQRRNRQLLKDIKFCVLGLGDSSYQKFNFSAKRLNNLLTFLGGEAVLKIGLGDDMHDLGPDFVIDSWIKELWIKLLDLNPLPPGIEAISSSILPPPKYRIKFIDECEDQKYNCNFFLFNSEKDPDILNPYFADITMNKQVTAETHFQEVRLIEFDIKDIQNKHKPGDVLMVQPENLPEHTEEFIQQMGLDPNKRFILESTDANTALPPLGILPQPCTIRECVQRYWDIQAVPKRSFFELLQHLTEDELQKEKFEEFTTAQGQQDLYDYCNRPKRMILEVLADFPNLKDSIPFEYLFDLVPAIKARAYSIASSSVAMPGKVQILSAVVNYRTIMKRERLGLCTNWLSRQEKGTKVPVWLKPGTLTFPDTTSLESVPPVIMIGPGTGCAPFRSYIQERISNGHCNNIVMIFGCRNRDGDFFFKDEWESLAAEKKLNLMCAFSRDQEDKIYVQHRMRENAEFLWDLISNKSAQVYFAGNAKRVPIDVYEALTYICEMGRKLGPQDAEQYMKKNLEKRYQTETWA
ncbi:unnamed protein product, partial [Meganyctiphanes norvegica]